MRVTDISTSMILILVVPFILKLLVRMPAVPGFLSIDCHQDGVFRKIRINHSFHAATKISFGRISPPEQKKRKLHKQKNHLFVLVIIVAFMCM
ncbi:MAG: hypothetical protein DWB48_08165 [Nitrosomonas sp.]|nr:hypothetical protein [Nitrosomonas sp.]